MAKKKIEDVIFLEDDSIIGWRPLKKGYIRNPLIEMCGALTEIKEYRSFDSFNIRIQDYVISGGVLMYIADLVRFDKNNLEKREKLRPKKELFFMGGLQIFKKEVIPGTNLNGFYLITNGRIWFTKEFLEDSINNSFYSHIFNDKKDKGKIEIINKIIKGYGLQEKQKNLGNRNSIHEIYMRGRRDTQEEICGTFGGR